jgi:hypothetical protein
MSKFNGEQTGPKVRKIAGKILAMDLKPTSIGAFFTKFNRRVELISAADILSMAGSLVNQSPGKVKPAARFIKAEKKGRKK